MARAPRHRRSHPHRKRLRIPRLYASRSRPGTSPGTLHPPTEKRVEQVTIRVTSYGIDGCEERQVSSVAEIGAPVAGSVTWIDVAGLHDVDLLRAFGDRFGLHPLALEDVLNVGQRPKLEQYEDHFFLVVKQIHLEDDRPVPEQISLFLLPGMVITFQEVPGDVLDPVRERIRQGRGRIRGAGPDYLAYAIVDALVDQFFPVLESFGDRLERLEEELIESPTRDTLAQIHTVKRDLILLRRAAWPHREVVNAFERIEPPAVARETKVFLRDCYDHAVQVLDILETYRDLASGMVDVYLSSVSNRLNEVMKVLTIIGAIFIPLTFIAGVYGMNFEHMPELSWRWGYPAVWIVMIATAAGMVWFFRRKGWL